MVCRIFIGILFFVIPFTSICQPDYSSFKKYSYPVVAYTKDQKIIGVGTGFFAKVKDKIFFITNKHIAYVPRCFAIMVVPEHDTTFYFVPANYPNGGTLDVAAFLVTQKVKGINCINDFIDSSAFDKIPKEVFAWGMPGSTFFSYTQVAMNHHLVVTKFESNYDLLKSKAVYDTQKTTFSEWLKAYKKENILLADSLKPGMSGSPIFGTFIVKGHEEAKFLGIVKSVIGGIKKTNVIKARMIFAYIKSTNQ